MPQHTPHQKKTPYTAEALEQIRSWVKDCPTWGQAKQVIVEKCDIHPDNATRLNKRFKLWVPNGETPPATGAPKIHAESSCRGMMDAPFDVAVETSTAATMEEVVGLMKVDLDRWEPRGFSVTRKKNGFGWNARFSKRPKSEDPRIIEDLKADIVGRAANPPQPVKHKPAKGGRLLVVAAFDAHLGKLSWQEQDGHNYDLKIAKEVYMRAIQDLVAKAQRYDVPISRILFPVGNDYMTCDTDTDGARTTAGTPQAVDGRFPKIYREARRLLVDAIEYLRQIAPVDVVVVPGNHERTSMFHLGDALECWFHGYKDVTVDNRWVPRKYYSYGETVFGLTHGDTIKQDKLPLGGAVEEPALWAKCKRRVWLLGHYHHYQWKEYMGVRVIVLPSISGSDGYHQSNGFIGAGRCSVALLYAQTGYEAMFESEPEN